MTVQKYLLFLGCVIPYRLPSYEISARRVLERLEVKIEEMPDFNCCGFPADPVNHELMFTLAARNLCIAERLGLSIMTLCNGCFGTLNKANILLKRDKELRERINNYLRHVGMEFKGTTQVKHLIHVLTEDVKLDKIREAIVKPLKGLKVAQHLGCHAFRPAEYIGRDNPDNMFILKDLIEATGAECVKYPGETDCCGNPIIGVNEEIPLSMAKEKLMNIKAVGADALVTICPFCYMMYDLNQPRIERTFNVKIGITILHYTQLLGLAMGLTAEEMKINELRIKPDSILKIVKA
ncbi:MAG: CoB--CoM heterodisulfide reductase iron-sulfur subunit B family protein [Nitrososphaerota archaeon]|nr:CoB--CoM heterodisulfide reductase iron-sulfur subunit B family protein [Candidatus Bathyarchaeota archaeon]MDW8048427.1 CoB--CoM heterodisulfide reductase iron-sulfur subunit B family protein [Nitrososphaerota archaeon]